MKTPSQEQKILFQLLRGELISLPEKLDHDKLFELFQQHRLFTISGPVKELLSGPEKERWKAVHQQNTMHSLKISSETIELIKYLKPLGIRAVPLKGPVLAHSLYGDVGLRHFNDIDLLVEKEHLDKTRDALMKLGYTLAYPGKMNRQQERIYTTYKKDIGLHNRSRRIFIELHYGIYVHKLLKESDERIIRSSTETVEIHNEGVEVLDKESTFIYLMYHGCLHQYSRLFWLRDVAECIKKWDLDHQQILVRMKVLGLDRMLGISLQLANHYFSVEIPDVYSGFLTENTGKQKLVNICHARICGPETMTFSMKLNKHRFLFNLKPGLRFKWAVLWSIFQRWRIRKFMGGH